MLNLLNAEFYKLRKSKSFKVAGALTVLFTTVIYFIHMLFQSGMIENVDMEAVELSRMDILQILHQMFANYNTIIFVTIFVCLFALGDYSSGAVKNFAGKGFRREEIYLARFLVTEFGAVMIYLLTALAVLAGGVIVFGTEQINEAVLYDFISFLFLQILYLTGYTAIIIMVCEFTRNTTGILISILGVMLFSTPLFQGMDLVFRALGTSFVISKYWILTVIGSCPLTDIPPKFVTGSGMIAGAWLIVSFVAGMLYFSREDIK